MSWVHSPGCDVGNSLCQEILSLTGQTLSSRGRQETHSSVQTWFSQISQEKCDLSPFYGRNFPRSLPGRPEYEMRDTKSKIGRYQEDHGSELQEQNTSSPWTFLGLFRSYNVTLSGKIPDLVKHHSNWPYSESSWQVWFPSLNWPALRSWFFLNSFPSVCSTSSPTDHPSLRWMITFLKLFALPHCPITWLHASIQFNNNATTTLSQSWTNRICTPLHNNSGKPQQIPLKLCCTAQCIWGGERWVGAK